MKRFIFFLLFLLSYNFTHIMATQDNSHEYITINENGERSFTLYAKYFITKEFCKILFNAPFMDLVKMETSSIYCCKANHKNNAKSLWVWLIFEFNEASISELKNHIYEDTSEELSIFVLQKYQNLRLFCPDCGEYSDYYIPEQQTSSQN